MTCRATLFEDVPRYDGPAGDTESTFHFLSRADGVPWQRVRNFLEAWYADYPDESGDLRARFRTDDSHQHVAAWWELYVYTLFRRFGYQVAVHPSVPKSSRKPDFLCEREGGAFYVECTALFGDEQSDAEAWVCECINSARNPDFMVGVDIIEAGKRRPRARELTQPIEQWLASLDYDIEGTRADTNEPPPEFSFSARDWVIRIRAFAVRADKRGERGRMIAVYPSSGVEVLDDAAQIRATLSRKGSQYGSLDKPFVVAVLGYSSFATPREVSEALFGSLAVSYVVGDLRSVTPVRKRNGYWRQGPPARGNRVSAVLFGSSNLHAWSAATELPRLWVNPWATQPMTSTMPIAMFTAEDSGAVISEAGTAMPSDVFELSSIWPGF